MRNAINRRSFVKASAALGLAAPCFMPAILRAASPNSKLRHACIGVGGMMGFGDLKTFLGNAQVEVAAICDVDKSIIDKALQEIAKQNKPKPNVYADWREMLAKEGARIDSINATVPDHMHAAITMAALKAGKHVYCQKPMCHDVAEIRAVMAAAKKAGVRTQLGTQHASSIGSRMAAQLIREGKIGKIKRVVSRANRPGIEGYRLAGPRPEKTQQPPDSLNWDLWLGTAPARPFAPKIYHPSVWRCWQDFGTGWSGDIGCHQFHAVWKALDLGFPISIEAKAQQSWVDSPARRADTWPQSNYIKWMMPGTKYTDGPLTIEWFDGEFVPDESVMKLVDNGKFHYESTLFIGTDGALMLPGGAPMLFPYEKFKSLKRPDLPGGDHYKDFVNGCVNNKETMSDFAFSGVMAEAVLLGTVALRVPGVKLEWNSEQMKFVNSADADRLLRRNYREGWKVEGV